MRRDDKGSIIRIALELDEKKAVQQAGGAAKKIEAALKSVGGQRPATLLQQTKAAGAAMESQARFAEISARASRNLAAADKESARASKALAEAKLAELRAQQAVLREQERAERLQRRNTFGSRFNRGVDSTRLNIGAASPLISSATRGGVAGLLGASLATGGGALVSALGSGFVSGLNDAKKLQQELSVLAVQGRITGKQLDELRDTARALGADLELPGVSSLDAARAMTALVRPLGDVQAASEGARGALQLAQIAEIDVAEAAKIAASSVNAFKLEAKDTATVADVLSRIIAVTGDSLEEISVGFSQASAMYAQAGFTIQELAQDYVALSQAGIKGSDAGTSLKTAVQRLISPTADAAKEMKRLGIEVYNATGQQRTHKQIIESVSTALSRLTPQQRAQATQTIFGTDAMRASNFVFAAGVEKADQLAGRLQKAAGAAETLAAKSKGLAGAQDAFNSALESFNEKHAAKFLNFVTEAVKSGSNLIDMLDRYIDRLSKAQGMNLKDPFQTFNEAVARSQKLDDPKARLSLVQEVLKQINSTGQVDPATGGKLDEYLLQRNPRNAKNLLPFANPGGFTRGGNLSQLRDFLADLSLDLIQEVRSKKGAGPDYSDVYRAGMEADTRRRRKSTTSGGGTPSPSGAASPSTANAELGLIGQQNTLKDLQARFSRIEKELGDAADEKTVAFYVQKLRAASAAITAQEKLIADAERRLALTENAGRKEPRDPRLIEAEARSKRLDASRDAGDRMAGVDDRAKGLLQRFAKQAEDRRKRAAEDAARLGKENATDSLETQVQQAERTLKKTEDRFATILKSMEKVTSEKGVTNAVADAVDVASELQQVGETLARLKKALGEKQAGRPTKALNDELNATIGPDGTLSQEFAKRLGDLTEAGRKAGERLSLSRTKGKEAGRETTAQIDEILNQQFIQYNQGVLEALEQELSATAATRKNAGRIDELLAAISRSRENLISLQLDAALADARRFRADLVARIAGEEDPNVKAALKRSLDAYDKETGVFSSLDEQGRPTGKSKTIVGGQAIAEYQARQAADRARREALRRQAEQVQGYRAEMGRGNASAAGVAVGAAAGAGVDALFSGGKTGAAVAESLRQSLVAGVRGELERSVERMTQAILTGTNEQRKAAGAQLVAALELRASASTLLALSGQRGRRAQGKAVLGSLLGLYLGDKAGLKGDALGSAVGVGASLLTGNVFGALMGLGKIGGLKLPKFASGGRMTGPGIVGDGGRPELFVPEGPGFILPDARSAMERLGQLAGGGSGRVVSFSPTFVHNGDIHDRADADRIVEAERRDLYDLALRMG